MAALYAEREAALSADERPLFCRIEWGGCQYCYEVCEWERRHPGEPSRAPRRS